MEHQNEGFLLKRETGGGIKLLGGENSAMTTRKVKSTGARLEEPNMLIGYAWLQSVLVDSRNPGAGIDLFWASHAAVS
ncbi:hypothetical protein LTR56_011489 [Elasticomyces elasticus]|nr:hypothetical protein LTR56_011489 [Elasticomyces elasticus]KAK3655917.1 hypothetical protein LTR22_009926 [Elasticomyces elasticus]KAK4921415.1 hypothetical protein LTR49_011069 [Elasticomyces elasticus]KAK5760111.1 hypothetical protein LTS12_009842 [Elasticomyces elasticus]